MKRILRVALPAALILSGILCAGVMVALSSSAEKGDAAVAITPVEVHVASAGPVPTRVDATGTVEPERQVSLSPEIAGAIVEISSKLLPGGRFAKGETIARIDTRDYSIAVAAEERAVQQAELELELERGRQKTSAREWEVLGDGRSAADAPLAVRAPHLEVAKVSLQAARGGLERAQLNLARTRLRAPFDAVVVAESIDVGQYVAPGSPVVTLVGTEALRVTVSVPVERLALLTSTDGAVAGAAARVTQDLGNGTTIRRAGQLEAISGQLDPQTRTAQLVVRVDQPFAGDGLPLLPGAYVNVQLDGRVLDAAFAIPRGAVYNGDTVWVADTDDTLARRTVHIAWSDERTVAVTSGLTDGERVITTPLSLPLVGAPVQVQRTSAVHTDAEEG